MIQVRAKYPIKHVVVLRANDAIKHSGMLRANETIKHKNVLRATGRIKHDSGMRAKWHIKYSSVVRASPLFKHKNKMRSPTPTTTNIKGETTMKKRKITFEGSLQSIKTSCAFCKAGVDFGGFSYIDAATKKAVCIKCVKKYAPELLGIPEKVEAYAEMTRELIAAKDGDPIKISDLRVNAFSKESQASFIRDTIWAIEAELKHRMQDNEIQMIEVNIFPRNSRNGSGMTFSKFDNGDTLTISKWNVERPLPDHTEFPFPCEDA